MIEHLADDRIVSSLVWKTIDLTLTDHRRRSGLSTRSHRAMTLLAYRRSTDPAVRVAPTRPPNAATLRFDFQPRSAEGRTLFRYDPHAVIVRCADSSTLVECSPACATHHTGDRHFALLRDLFEDELQLKRKLRQSALPGAINDIDPELSEVAAIAGLSSDNRTARTDITDFIVIVVF